MTRKCKKAEPEAPPWPTQAEFIRAWQTSRTLREVCSKLKMKRSAAKLRAWRYRNWHGVPLKDMEFDPAVESYPDWDELAQYAEEFVAPDASSGDVPADEPEAGPAPAPA